MTSSHCLHRWSCVWCCSRAGATGADAPKAGPRSPRDEQAAFVLADPALTIELVAAEPEVTSPVAIAWDEDGRLYVAEMIDYPVATAAGRIRRLEDRDGDGRYEHATVFADGLPFPNGVLPCFGGVLVTAAPNIWFFRDRDGDGRADEKAIVLTGFGEGNTQLRVNGLSFGLDNMIYAANGRSDGEVRSPNDPPAKAVSIGRPRSAVPPGGAARSRTPEATSIEAIAGFSQFGLAHDDWGNRFPSWNTIPVRHVVLEQQTLDRNPYLAETSCVASILDMADGGRIFSISPAQARFNRESVAFFNASCGPMIERGGLLPAAYHGNAFVCEPLSNLVHRRVLEPDGVTFVARRVGTGKGVPRLVGSRVSAGQPGDRPGRSALRRRHVPRAGRASPVRPGVGARHCRLSPLARSRTDLASPSQVATRGCRWPEAPPEPAPTRGARRPSGPSQRRGGA